jgi:hypothetical protein
MTDGAESLLRLKSLLPVPTRFVLDYFHVSMKLRHIDQCIGTIPPIALSPDGSIFELYDRFNFLRGYLWSGKRAKFEESVDRLLELLDHAKEMLPNLDRSINMASGHLCDLAWYIRKNEPGVINYGRWRREGRRISTSAVEGTVNRLIGRRLGKGQHMCWNKRGAHLLLQVRCAVLNGELLERFQRWFPAWEPARSGCHGIGNPPFLTVPQTLYPRRPMHLAPHVNRRRHRPSLRPLRSRIGLPGTRLRKPHGASQRPGQTRSSDRTRPALRSRQTHLRLRRRGS